MPRDNESNPGFQESESKESVFDKFPTDLKSKQRFFAIFGSAVGTPSGSYGYNEKDVSNFYEKYPNREKFEVFAQRYLTDIEKANSPEKRKEYEVVIQNFADVMY